MSSNEEPPFPRELQPPVACPHCGAHLIRPVRVSTRKDDPDNVDVHLSCDDCKQTWIVQKLTDEVPRSQ